MRSNVDGATFQDNILRRNIWASNLFAVMSSSPQV
jgi:hypothetical protein